MEEKSNIKKWLGGIAAAIISGVAVFWLTEGLVNKQSEVASDIVSQPPASVESSPDPSGDKTSPEVLSESQPELDESPQVSQISSVEGIWDVTILRDQKVSRDGFVEDASGSVNYVWDLKSTGNRVTGKLLGAKSEAIRNACSQGDFNGEITDAAVEMLFTFTGSCCSEEVKVYSLTLSSDQNTFEGITKPQDIPTGSCTLWYGDVVGTRRSE